LAETRTYVRNVWLKTTKFVMTTLEVRREGAGITSWRVVLASPLSTITLVQTPDNGDYCTAAFVLVACNVS